MAMTKKQISEFQERKREIEENSLKSTTESLKLLKETQRCGIVVAEELSRQGEQLKMIDTQLDNVNGTLKMSQKHINGMKYMFSGFKNLFSKKEQNVEINPVKMDMKDSQANSSSKNKQQTYDVHQAEKYPTYETTEDHKHLIPKQDFESVFNENMNEMSKSISMLKALATDMGQEIDNQNDLIDGITRKTDQADTAIQQQNKQMKKILGK